MIFKETNSTPVASTPTEKPDIVSTWVSRRLINFETPSATAAIRVGGLKSKNLGSLQFYEIRER